MLRKQFMQGKIHTHDIKHVIGHNGSIYIKHSLVTIILLFVLYVIYVIVSDQVVYEYLPWIFGALGVIVLVKYIIDFLNLYLDGLALSPGGMTLFLWEGLLEYRTEYFDRSKIVTINHHQAGIWDKIFGRGDILINLEQGIEFPFENVSSPKKQVDKIMRLKDMYSRREMEELGEEIKSEQRHQSEDHMKIVMEAFGEVVKEYMDKKNQDDHYHGGI